MERPFLPAPTREWLQEFARAVRERDFDFGQTLFAPDSFSFGTVAARTSSLAELVQNQWQHVWPRTSNFDFDYDSARIWESESVTSIALCWRSQGFDAHGQQFERTGRATFVLEQRENTWKAVHSHFSMEPTGPDDARLHRSAGEAELTATELTAIELTATESAR